jgi:integrase
MVALLSSRGVAYATAPAQTLGTRLFVCEAGRGDAPKPRLLDRVRQAIVARHYSRRTEKAYVHWIKRYIFFHLLFLYREVLGVDLAWLDEIVRAKRPLYLPVVLTRDEVRAVLQQLDDVPRLMAVLLYGAGLRLLECCRLCVKDVDFAMNQITIRDGKGHKDRPTMLPASVKGDLVAHPSGACP